MIVFVLTLQRKISICIMYIKIIWLCISGRVTWWCRDAWKKVNIISPILSSLLSVVHRKKVFSPENQSWVQNCCWCSLCCSLFDPLGRPTDYCPYVRTSVPTFQTKQTSGENNYHYWWDCGSGREDHWWHMSCLLCCSCETWRRHYQLHPLLFCYKHFYISIYSV